MPDVFVKQKKRKITLFICGIILLGLGSIFGFYKINQLRNAAQNPLSTARKIYYVQFDLSEISKKTGIPDELQRSLPDTISLKENLTAQVFNLLNPDSVVTESDIANAMAKEGKFFTRHKLHSGYFCDTLKYSGEMYFKAAISDQVNSDSLLINLYLDNYLSSHEKSSSSGSFTVSIKNIIADFRDGLQEYLLWIKLSKVQGYVITCQDNIILFRLNKDTRIRKGTFIHLNRQISGKQQIENWVMDIREEISFYQGKPQYAANLKKAVEKLKYVNETALPGIAAGLREVFSEELTGRGKVIEIYDSTGKAEFRRKGIAPWDIPRKGDCIFISN